MFFDNKRSEVEVKYVLFFDLNYMGNEIKISFEKRVLLFDLN